MKNNQLENLYNDLASTTLPIEELAKKYADNIIRIKDGCIKGSLPRVKNEVSTQVKDVKRNLKFTEMIKITMANFMNNKIRNILTVVAFMIGLFSKYNGSILLECIGKYSMEIYN